MWDDLEYLRDDMLIEADSIEEVGLVTFWQGYREDELPLEERDVSYEEEMA